MKEMIVNGLRIRYERERALFNTLLKINGVTKKQFAEKFDLSYSYVNTWGSTTSRGEVKFPSWVFVYLKDVLYFKIAAIRLKMGLSKIYDALESGKTLTDLYRELYLDNSIGEDGIFIPDELIAEEASRYLSAS